MATTYGISRIKPMCYPARAKTSAGCVCEVLVRFHAKDGNQFVTHDAVWRPEEGNPPPTMEQFKKEEAEHMNLLFANERAKDKLDSQLTKEDPIPYREYVTPDMAIDLTVVPTKEEETPPEPEAAPTAVEPPAPDAPAVVEEEEVAEESGG